MHYAGAGHRAQGTGLFLNKATSCRWNFSASPGWTYEEKAILKLLLRAHGVGKWKQFTDSNLLPGKKITQMNGQTQRLVGQQSLAGMVCILAGTSASRVSYQ